MRFFDDGIPNWRIIANARLEAAIHSSGRVNRLLVNRLLVNYYLIKRRTRAS